MAFFVYVICNPRRKTYVGQTSDLQRRLAQHNDPDCRAFIGRLDLGFTFLGQWITKLGVTGVAPRPWEAIRERVARLYEQYAPQEEIRRRIRQYARRWKRWALSGVWEAVVSGAPPG